MFGILILFNLHKEIKSSLKDRLDHHFEIFIRKDQAGSINFKSQQ